MEMQAINRDSDGRDSSATLSPVDEKQAVLEQFQMKPVTNYPKGFQFAIIMIGLWLAVFIIALDGTVVGPTIPIISNKFQTITDVVWYIAAFYAISTAFQPIAGTLFTFELKYTFIAFVVLFEVGSVICGAAQTSFAFIWGRSLCGLGTSGLYIGAMTIIGSIVPLEEKALWSNSIGGAYSLGAVAGPLIGGVFTTKASWRWAYFINLPFGAITILALLFFKDENAATRRGKYTLRSRLASLDYIGTILLLGFLILVCLALQNGGMQHAWNSAYIIGSLSGAGALFLLLIASMLVQKEKSIIPPRLCRIPTVFAGFVINLAVGGAYFSILLFLVFHVSLLNTTANSQKVYYFQVLGSSALRSGVQLLPEIAGVLFGMTASAAALKVIRYVPPIIYFGLVSFIIGVGCLTLFDVGTSTAMWAGITVLTGFSSGFVWQMPFICGQASLPEKDRDVGSIIIIFSQTLGATLITSIGQAIYQNHVKDGLVNLLGPSGALIAQAGVTEFRTLVPADLLPEVVDVTMEALRKVWYAPIALLGIALCFVPVIKWVRIEADKI